MVTEEKKEEAASPAERVTRTQQEYKNNSLRSARTITSAASKQASRSFSGGRAAAAALMCRGRVLALSSYGASESGNAYRGWVSGVLTLTAAAYMLQEKEAHAAEMERTFIAIKPDGVQRGLISEIISRFERKGYKLVAIKILVPSKDFAQKHYHDLKERPFFNGLCDFLSSGPVIAMVWEGEGVIKYGRKLIGATDPQKSEPGTIRGDLAVVVGRNIIHGSDGPETAKDEIKLWFKPEELHRGGGDGDDDDDDEEFLLDLVVVVFEDVKNEIEPRMEICDHRWEVQINGALHSLLQDISHVYSDKTFRMMGFSVVNENHYELMLPKDIPIDNVSMNLNVLGGCLSLATTSKFHVVIWVMKKYGVEKSWSQFVSVGQIMINSNDNLSASRPMSYSKSGEKVLLYVNEERLICYDLRRNVIIDFFPFHFVMNFVFKALFGIRKYSKMMQQ
ncbi:unnamed protein product [Fraxinus pennsylvanica]|uniref:Nucleoside diphosphate kinase n=1 Tax=Fraxinus pennsylvanica TaxID=56036 RepID=A0AAD1YZA3_9LAMI|nr:unnamed protein product [Fraxinus pennsylvanica]